MAKVEAVVKQAALWLSRLMHLSQEAVLKGKFIA